MDDVAHAMRTRVKYNGISYLLVASVAWGINWYYGRLGAGARAYVSL